ncbi:hypothetical protein, conserved [Trypanosoma brucei gambiense DAL972]|uniref:Uncharacterized protein n=1 Tax=Trypanosoma brucei gambiense (strain MHOM/CI/86/DAL972) TaxID=679716 RepID=D0A9F5_TRYB9|nr:hypothetical protein, conserved [Trypanosoma brucei gambiense DAL972]CBH18306.1 hypothetical protein, conserved [Trypanosoma brucei gambiense DAL972]|eukprot:XP_011780570.1 hypothetical protein, conserved [Trypanosoma brucei gambiense DAL972]
MTILSLHGRNGADAQKWFESGLLPFPGGQKSFEMVSVMPALVYHHCMLYWAKLGCAALLQEGSVEMTGKAGSETLMFVVRNICCIRIAESPRCLPNWRLLDRVLDELLKRLDFVANCEDGVWSFASTTMRRMQCYLRSNIIRYLEVRDRPLEGQCGLLRYRGAFDCAINGVNSSGASGMGGCQTTDEVHVEVLSAETLRSAVQVMCGCDGVKVPCGDSSGGVKDGADALADLELEEFFCRYFLCSAPAAFDQPTKPTVRE